MISNDIGHNCKTPEDFWEYLWRSFHGYLFVVAKNALNRKVPSSEHDAEDIVADTLLNAKDRVQILCTCKQLRDESELRRYLVACVKHAARRHITRMVCRNMSGLPLDLLHDHIIHSPASSHNHTAECSQHLTKAIISATNEKEALALSFARFHYDVFGFPLHRILGITPNNLRVLTHRAKNTVATRNIDNHSFLSTSGLFGRQLSPTLIAELIADTRCDVIRQWDTYSQHPLWCPVETPGMTIGQVIGCAGLLHLVLAIERLKRLGLQDITTTMCCFRYSCSLFLLLHEPAWYEVAYIMACDTNRDFMIRHFNTGPLSDAQSVDFLHALDPTWPPVPAKIIEMCGISSAHFQHDIMTIMSLPRLRLPSQSLIPNKS